ncbi:hypothetical protein [Brochothrix thermosphacta]|uniref:hypothetical protein n=1 Tax=Brochothrix thermosphacta TaxID=2756 RepID=UPI00083FBEA8|nr:hypothetical protein [Brochothrix thermosphacta]ODJ68479.1 hypothetical protein BFR36_01430 [Brochothrix thermosphacta]ODJ71672.1 hypothetical protein BFR45_10505 [Brochothrix thermosphacta]ODJ74386.1 hypothetical protein BFR39_00105 [Brochothrix thermosphacta]
MTKKVAILQSKLRMYRTSLYVTLILIATYSAFIGKTQITTIDLTRGMKSFRISDWSRAKAVKLVAI